MQFSIDNVDDVEDDDNVIFHFERTWNDFYLFIFSNNKQ